jgi:hypothetical protein
MKRLKNIGGFFCLEIGTYRMFQLDTTLKKIGYVDAITKMNLR